MASDASPLLYHAVLAVRVLDAVAAPHGARRELPRPNQILPNNSSYSNIQFL